MIRFLHAADFHLDSAFAALGPRQAAERRRESRELAFRLAEYVNAHDIDLVLLAGDLFDSGSPYRDTGEQLSQALGQMRAKVFAAPGNHDWYGPGSPWTAVSWPDNVTVFTRNAMETALVPEWNLAVHGGAFTAPEQNTGLLHGFTAPEDGLLHIGLLHGELDPRSPYNPIAPEDADHSGLAYLALGHIHKRGRREGKTLCAWPGCLEGRGFDELGEKGFYTGTLHDDGPVSLEFVPFAPHRYEIFEADVTGQDPRAALDALLPPDTSADLYRILLTGETGEDGVRLPALHAALESRFYALELRDRTRLRQDLWSRTGEDSLRGLFLQDLRQRLDAAVSDNQRHRIEAAARIGLAALDHRDLG